jgi:hypothetical protein
MEHMQATYLDSRLWVAQQTFPLHRRVSLATTFHQLELYLQVQQQMVEFQLLLDLVVT